MNLLEHIAFRLKALTDSRHRQFFLQRMVKDLPARERRADRLAARLPRPMDNGHSSVAEPASFLKEQGFVLLPGVMKPEWLKSLVTYFTGHECSDPYRPALGSFKANGNVPAGTHVAYFSNEVVAQAPHIFEIANHPVILQAVSSALGAKPTISYMTAWWSLPAGDGTAQHAEKFHRDVDDWRFIKLFCYLTDVDETSGPHVFVRGSQRINALTEIRRFSDEEVSATFGADNIVRFTGPAGTCFLENTYGVHRGIPPASKARLIFQVLYSLRPVIYGPKSPVAQRGMNGIPEGIDPYVNRIYCANR